jgi:gliding motility-associated lipoprotein GldH
MKNNSIILVLILILLISVASCVQSTTSEKTVSFKDHQWLSSYKPWIDIDITDTTDLYNIYAVIRHTDNFQYNNLMLNYYFIAPGDSAKMQKIILPIGENNHWFGDTLESTIETRVKINKKPIKLSYGKNSFIFQQLMPADTLKHILNMGIRIEKKTDTLGK